MRHRQLKGYGDVFWMDLTSGYCATDVMCVSCCKETTCHDKNHHWQNNDLYEQARPAAPEFTSKQHFCKLWFNNTTVY